jgi:hypothetical protein
MFCKSFKINHLWDVPHPLSLFSTAMTKQKVKKVAEIRVWQRKWAVTRGFGDSP